MQFGQFTLMGHGTPGSGADAPHDGAVAQARAAEQAGFEIAWFAEHPLSNACVCPSPLLMVARCAGETSRIRLGSGFGVVPLQDPARLLAEIGLADQLCHGRLVLGLGGGDQPFGFGRGHADPAEASARVAEVLEMLALATAGAPFSYQGRYHRLPETHLAARPVHGLPEIWIAGDHPALHRLAARRGHPVMVGPRHHTAALLAAARARLAASHRAAGADPGRLRLGALRHVFVTESRAEAAEFLDHIRNQRRPPPPPRPPEQAPRGDRPAERPWPGEMRLGAMAQHMLVGDAETIAERLVAEIRAARPCRYLLQFQAGGSSLRWALRSIDRFATLVRPMLEAALGPLDRLDPLEAAA